MKDPKTDAMQFSNDVHAWLHQFLDSNYFYQASDITPHMHVLVYHISEMMRIHYNFGLAAFSCSAIEKKTTKFLIFLKEQQKMVVLEKDESLQLLIFLNMKIDIYFLKNIMRLT